jgi:hypothetical protein
VNPIELYRQNRDKMRTYDMARVQYTHVRSMLLVDADELLLCGGGGLLTIQGIAKHQQELLDSFTTRTTDEMSFSRPTVFGKFPPGLTYLGLEVLNDLTMRCMEQGYYHRSLAVMMRCWGQVNHTMLDRKAVDISGICPFHYNHWGCSPRKPLPFPSTRCHCPRSVNSPPAAK